MADEGASRKLPIRFLRLFKENILGIMSLRLFLIIFLTMSSIMLKTVLKQIQDKIKFGKNPAVYEVTISSV